MCQTEPGQNHFVETSAGGPGILLTVLAILLTVLAILLTVLAILLTVLAIFGVPKTKRIRKDILSILILLTVLANFTNSFGDFTNSFGDFTNSFGYFTNSFGCQHRYRNLVSGFW